MRKRAAKRRFGRLRRGQDYNIKMYLKETERENES